MRLLTIDDVAERLAVSPRTVRRLVDRREITWNRVGGQIRFSEQAVTAFIKRTERTARA